MNPKVLTGAKVSISSKSLIPLEFTLSALKTSDKITHDD